MVFPTHELTELAVNDTENHERENHRRNTDNHHGSPDGNERGQHHYSDSHDCVNAIGSVRRLRFRERGSCRPDGWNHCRNSSLCAWGFYVPSTQEKAARGGGADERRFYGPPPGQFRRYHVEDGHHVERRIRYADGRGEQLHVPEQEAEHEAPGSSA